MKRLVAIILAAVLVLSMSVAVFAAGSPEDGGFLKDITGEGLTKAEVEVTMGKSTNEEVMAAAKELGVPENASILSILDIHLKSGDIFANSAVATIVSDNVTPDAEIYVIHKMHDGKWELLDAKAGNKEVTITFAHGFSDFAVMIVPKTDNKPADDKKEEGTSPKTGETPIVAILAGVAVLAAAGIVVSRRKAANN